MKFKITDLLNLSEEDLKKLATVSQNTLETSKVLKKNSEALRAKMQGILLNSLAELKNQEKIDDAVIEKIFNDTIGSSIEAFSKTIDDSLKEKLETTDIFLLDNVIVSKFLKILESVLELEKQIDTMYPGTSEKIIDALEILLIGTIATHMPVIALLIKTTGLLDGIKNCIQVDNLLPKVKEWNKQIDEKKERIQQDNKLESIYTKAENVAQVSQKAEISPIEVAKLNLKNDSLKELNKLVEDPKEKGLFQKFVEAMTVIPINSNEIGANVSTLKTKLIDSIKDIDPKLKNSLEEIINKNLDKIEQDLNKLFNPKITLMEKISISYGISTALLAIPDEIKNKTGILPKENDVVQKIKDCLNQEKNKLLPTAITKFTEYSPKLTQALGIAKALSVILKRESQVSKSMER